MDWSWLYRKLFFRYTFHTRVLNYVKYDHMNISYRFLGLVNCSCNYCSFQTSVSTSDCNFSKLTSKHIRKSFRNFSSVSCNPYYITFSDSFGTEERKVLVNDMVVIEDFLNENEEKSLLNEVDSYMKRLRYEFAHWDDIWHQGAEPCGGRCCWMRGRQLDPAWYHDMCFHGGMVFGVLSGQSIAQWRYIFCVIGLRAIHGYRETERLKWNPENTKILNRIREIAFPANCAQLQHVHVLDLAQNGYIKPHIDATRFCGNIIAGISLLSDSVMRLVHDKDKRKVIDILLKQRSLYIMRDSARYDYTHEILANEVSKFNGQPVSKTRRISIICRNEPSSNAE